MAVYLTEQSTVLEGNLLASIISTQDKIKEWAVLAKNAKTLEESNAADEKNNKTEESSTNQNEDNNENQSGQNEQSSEQINNKVSNQYRYDDVLLDYPYCITISEINVQETSSLLSKTCYITYGINIRRLIDGEINVVHKRFRDIKSWYQDLVKSFDEINIGEVAEFPQYTESWLSSRNTDPKSEIVQRRKRDLEDFFQCLFCHFPMLYQNKQVIDFLELKKFRAAAVSTYTLHYAHAASNHNTNGDSSNTDGKTEGDAAKANAAIQSENLFGTANPNLFYNQKKGRLEKKKAGDQTYKSDINNNSNNNAASNQSSATNSNNNNNTTNATPTNEGNAAAPLFVLNALSDQTSSSNSSKNDSNSNTKPSTDPASVSLVEFFEYSEFMDSVNAKLVARMSKNKPPTSTHNNATTATVNEASTSTADSKDNNHNTVSAASTPSKKISSST